MKMMARPATLLPPLAKTTIDWVQRCPKVDNMEMLQHINRLLVRAENGANWLAGLTEFLILATTRPESALTGVKGLIHYNDAEFVGSPTFLPNYGFQRSQSEDAVLETFIRFPLRPYDAGMTDTDIAFGVYLFTNFLGLYLETGSGTTGTNVSIGIRASGGFRPTMAIGSPSILYGGGQNWGFHFGYRKDDLEVTSWREATKQVVASVTTGLHLGNFPFTLLSIEPSGPYNTANGQSFWMAGRGSLWTDDMVLQMRQDLNLFLIETGVYDSIIVDPVAPGPNCFGPDSLATIPAPTRVFIRARFPGTNTTPATAYNRYPCTDSISSAILVGNATLKNPEPPAVQNFNDPITTTAGSDLAWLAYPGLNNPSFHAFAANYGMDSIGFTGGNGLAPADVNGRRFIVAADLPGQRLQFRLGATATASGVIGGVAGQTKITAFRPAGPAPGSLPSQQFIPPRGGRLGHFIPIFRSNGQDVLDAGAPALNGKGSAMSPPITRTTDHGTIKAGANCIMLYSSWEKSVYAMLTHCAENAGYAKRNEARDPLGQGWMDIAEEGGFTEDQVQPWKYFHANADAVFTSPTNIFGGCWDHIYLDPVRLSDLNCPMSQLAQWFDCEHGDRIPPDLNEWRYQRWDQICGATGIKWWNLGHFMVDPQAIHNGFTTDNSRRIIGLPNGDGFSLAIIPTYRPGAEDIIAFAERQYRFCSGPNGDDPPPPDRFLITGQCGAGKFNIDDPGPFGQQQTRLADCDRLAAWMAGHGMTKFMIAQGGATMGGPIERYWNQQLIHFLPGLASTPPPVTDDPNAVVQAWAGVVLGLGGNVSENFADWVMRYVDALILQQIWPKLTYLLLCCAEDTQGMQVDLRYRLIGTMPASPSTPTLVPLQGWDLDGVNDHYDTGYIPATMHHGVVTFDHAMMGMYQRIPRSEVANTQIMGTIDATVNSTDGMWRLIPRTVTGQTVQVVFSTLFDTFVGAVDTPWDGMFLTQRDGNAYQVYRNSALVVTANTIPPISASVLPGLSLQVGCGRNGAGAPAFFRACNPQIVFAGAPLTASEVQAFNAATQAFLVGIGASSGGTALSEAIL
jgi:hypothetical protein